MNEVAIAPAQPRTISPPAAPLLPLVDTAKIHPAIVTNVNRTPIAIHRGRRALAPA